MEQRYKAMTNVEQPIRPTYIKEKFSKLALNSNRKPKTESEEQLVHAARIQTPTMQDTTRRTLFTDDESDEESAPLVGGTSKNKILLTPRSSNESEHQMGTQNIKLHFSDSDETVCTSVDQVDKDEQQSAALSQPLFSRSTLHSDESLFGTKKPRPTELSDSVSNLSARMSCIGLAEPESNSHLEPLVYEDDSATEAEEEDDQEVTVISDTSEDESEAETPPQSVKKEKVIVISDSEEESVEVEEEEFYSKVVSRLSNCSQALSHTMANRLDNFFDNIPAARNSERFSFLRGPPKDDHVEKIDKSNEKEVIPEEDEEVPESSDESEQSVPLDHVEIAESADEEVAEEVVEPAPEPKSKQSMSTEANTDLVPSDNVLSAEVRTPSTPKQTSFSGKINISAKIKINIQVTHHSSDSDTSSSSSDSDNSVPPPRQIRISSHRKVNVTGEKTPGSATKWNVRSNTSSNTKKTPATSASKRTPRRSDKNNSLRAHQMTPRSEKLAKELENVKLADDDEVEDDKKEDIIDEAMEEILNSVYGTKWQTPALLKDCASRKKAAVHPDFSLFDKKIACNLESTRLTAIDKSTAADDDGQANPAKIVTSPFFTSPKPKVASKPATPASAAVRLDRIRARRQDQQQSARKQATAICDSDTSSEEEATESDGSWKCDNKSETTSSDSEASPVETKVKTKGGARTRRRAEPIKFRLSESDKENARTSEESDDELNGTLSKRFLNLLDSCEYRPKPSIPATPDNIKEISDILKDIDTSIKAPTTTKRKLYTKRYSTVVSESTENDRTGESRLDESSLIEDDVMLKMPIPDFLRLPTNKKLEQVKNIDAGLVTPKPKAKEKVATPKSKTKKVTNQEPVKIQAPGTTAYGFLQSLDVTISKSLGHPEAVAYRENYKARKEELAAKLFDLYNEKVFGGQLVVPITWNKKLLNTAGRCNNSKRMGVRSSRIELSDKVLTSADRLRCTLIHEMAHAATWIFSAENGHGATWKSWAQKANQIFPELPRIGTCHNYQIEYKYTYECVTCKAKYNAHSKSKKVEKIRCSYCHGAIQVFLNKKDKAGNIVATPVREAAGFAKFVKEKYKAFKRPDLKHADVMKLLSGEFAALAVEEKNKY